LGSPPAAEVIGPDLKDAGGASLRLQPENVLAKLQALLDAHQLMAVTLFELGDLPGEWVR